jgi:plastocyanin
MNARSFFTTIHRPLLFALGGMLITSSGLIMLRPTRSAADGPHVSIVEPDAKKSDTWKFDPHDVTIKAGTTVVWDWKGKDKHSATADDGSWDSGVKTGAGQRWDHKFDAPGDYPYSCTPHSNMTGMIHVTP